MLNLRGDVKYLRRAILKEIEDRTESGKDITYDALAEGCECGRMTIIRHIKALQQSGHIEVTRGRPNSYRVIRGVQLA